jgi:hypothetical protein
LLLSLDPTFVALSIVTTLAADVVIPRVDASRLGRVVPETEVAMLRGGAGRRRIPERLRNPFWLSNPYLLGGDRKIGDRDWYGGNGDNRFVGVVRIIPRAEATGIPTLDSVVPEGREIEVSEGH